MRFILALSLFLIMAIPTNAQSPTPEIPYDFQPVDFESGPENPVAGEMATQMQSTENINQIGSYVLTPLAILDAFAGGGVLGYAVLFMGGVFALKWLAGYVYGKSVLKEGSKELEKDMKELKSSKVSRRNKAIF